MHTCRLTSLATALPLAVFQHLKPWTLYFKDIVSRNSSLKNVKPAFCSIPLHCVPAVFVIVRKDSVLPALSKTCKNMRVTWRVTLLQSQSKNKSVFAFLFLRAKHAYVSQGSPDLAFSNQVVHLRAITENVLHLKICLACVIALNSVFVFCFLSNTKSNTKP